MKKRKRYLNETEKKRLKIILYFFLVISFLSFLSLIIITILSKKSVINEEAEIMYFVGDSKILDLDIGDERLIRLEYKEFESISEIVEYVNELYNFCKIQI